MGTFIAQKPKNISIALRSVIEELLCGKEDPHKMSVIQSARAPLELPYNWILWIHHFQSV